MIGASVRVLIAVLRLGSLSLLIAATGCEIVFPLTTPPPDAPPDAPPVTRRAFVTETQFTGGEIGGLVGADAKCQVRAETAGLSGMYKAWLSDSTGSPATRFVQSTVPYVRLDRVVIANGWADLTDGILNAPINKTDTGVQGASDKLCVTNTTYVFANTAVDGTQQNGGFSCADWTSNAGMSAWGDSADAMVAWTVACSGGGTAPIFCGAKAALYCFEQ